jgi:hypothetical protein
VGKAQAIVIVAGTVFAANRRFNNTSFENNMILEMAAVALRTGR